MNKTSVLNIPILFLSDKDECSMKTGTAEQH